MNQSQKIEKTIPFPEYGPKHIFRMHAQTKVIGEQSPYFAVGGEIFRPGARDWECCGCLHDEISKAWPEVRPLIALHLSDALTGEPMHAEANGWYWLAGILGGCGEQYHGGNRETYGKENDCLGIFADHCRVSRDEAQAIADRMGAEPDNGKRKAMWMEICEGMKPRWAAEAKAGLDLIERLSQKAA